MTTPRPREDLQADGFYQLDAVVSLFAVLLLVLLFAAAVPGSGETRLDYATRDPEGPAFRLSSLASPYPRLETWVLGAETLVGLDYDAAARLLATASGGLDRGVSDPASGIDVSIDVAPGEPGSYDRLSFVIPASVRAGGIAAAVHDPRVDAERRDWAADVQAPVRLVVRPGGRRHLPALAEAAASSGIAWQTSLVPGGPSAPIASHRRAGSFSRRRVMRVY